MSNDKNDQKNNGQKKANEKIVCHFVSNTHWDREWQYSFERTRYMLVYLIDMLLDIFEKEPRFKYFVLDSQTAPLQDYLQIMPQKREKLEKLISDGKLVVGPWFTLPDVNIVGAESLIRNLLVGHKIARSFGKLAKTGYSPFSWGHLSQMPQIYKGFDIELMAFYRGVNTDVAPRSEFIWRAPDGSEIVGNRLGLRPRYNVWYLVHRAAIWDKQDVNNRDSKWSDGGAPFRFANPDKSDINYQLAHPPYIYNPQRIKEQCLKAIEEQNGDWTTPHRFWGNGHDWSCPDIREGQLVEDCNEALGDTADVIHSTFEEFQKGVLSYKGKLDWPLYEGEMRKFPKPDWKTGPLMANCLSSRMYIKQDNYNTERNLTYYAEPLAVFASLLGAPYPQEFIDYAYNMLLQNHGHDSVGTCCRDTAHRDMLFRSSSSREVSTCVMERALVEIAGSIDLSEWDKNEMALVVYNPAALKRDDVVRLNLDIPKEWNATGFEIVDQKGNKVATQKISVDPDRFHYIQTPNEVQTLLYSQRYDLLAEFKDLPQMGYKAYKVKPLTGELFPDMPETMVTGPASMENEHLVVKVNSNGTLYVRDKKSNVEFDSLGYFRDLGDNGDPWWHKPPTEQGIFTSLNETAKVSLVSNGKLEASFRVELNWALPEDNTIDGSARSQHKKNLRIVNTVTLRKGQKWVEIATDVDNCIKNHWLQVALPTGLETDTVSAQSHFDVIERPTAESPNIVYASEFDSESPLDDFIDISDGKKGLGFIAEGLKAYIPLRDNDNTIAVSLLRTMPLRLGWAKPLDHSSYEQDNQMLGKCSYRYAFIPHKGNWQEAKMWQKSQEFNLVPQAGQIGPSKHGTEPMCKSFLEIDPAETLHVSAVKRSEDGSGWVVRLFNPTDKAVKTTVKFNNGHSSPGYKPSPVERVKSEFALPGPAEQLWKKVELTNLDERPLEQLETDNKGAVKVNITKKKIVTIKFTPAS